MKIFLTTWVLLSFLFMQSIEAKGPKHDMFGNQLGGGEMASYDPSTITTLEGTIKEINFKHNPEMGNKGLHLYIATEKGQYKIHVAPEWVIKKENIVFEEDEVIRVTGSVFDSDNMFAAAITRNPDSQNPTELNFRNVQTGERLWGRR